ncbi:GumC family protein [Neorhizobium sp. JUb45]|uniref:GumC family protein n=1 Tax=unclassified Neorhizobium TaxID=2629175 RepID=UPI00105371B1|nr:GumC family protein [Neorhizobium sp. JUb45]TCR06057.1 uncharacterized protein involved in exopolysaccharide biosynthesis [Neorhizobium sp. JUb45]
MIFQSANSFPRDDMQTDPRKPRITIGDLVEKFWSARFWAVGGAVLLAVLCLAITPFIKPVYEASAQIYIDPQNLQVLQNDLTPALSGGDSGVLIAESQVRIMQSASVLKLVVEKLGLVGDEEFGGPSESRLSFGSSGQSDVDPVQVAIERLSKNVNVVREDRTYMISVYARSHSPTRAAEIANAVVDGYLQVRDGHRTEVASVATGALEGRLVALQAALKEREDAVAKFKVDNNIVDANGIFLAESRLNQNNTVVSTSEDLLNKRRVERDQLRELLSSPERFLSSPVATASADFLRLRGELERSEAELSVLQATLGQRHPRVVTASTRLAAVRRSINAEMVRLAENADIDYERARSEYAVAQKSMDPLVSEVQKIDAARIQWRQLQRDADSARAVYEEALTRSRETREQGLMTTLNAQVVSRASTPIRRRSPPSLSLLLMVSVALGGSLGLALGVGYDGLRQQVRGGRRAEDNDAPASLLDMEERPMRRAS